MTKPIIILLLITIPFQGIVYTIPVPSEGGDRKAVPMHGGGSIGEDFLFMLIPPEVSFFVLGAAMVAFMRSGLIDEDHSNDIEHIGIGLLGGAIIYFLFCPPS